MMKKITWTKKVVLLVLTGIIFVSTSVVTMASIFNSKRINAGVDFSDNKIDLRAGKTFARSWVDSLANSKDKCKKLQLAAGRNSVFVPFKTKQEWDSFLIAAKAGQIDGLNIKDCCSVFGDTFGGDFCG